MAAPLLVSVVIPVHNAGRYLGAAIQSILGQGHPHIEVIVIDDGSTDGSEDIARSFGPPVRCVSQPAAGIGAARNAGVALARGELLAFLDADDLWPEGSLGIRLAALEMQSELEAVFGHMRQFRDPSKGEDTAPTQADEPAPSYFAGSMLIHREAFLRVGPFATQWHVGEFLDWYMRARDLGLNMLMLPDVVLLRRLHGDNQGIRRRDSQADYLHVLKAALDRRRNGEDGPTG